MGRSFFYLALWIGVGIALTTTVRQVLTPARAS